MGQIDEEKIESLDDTIVFQVDEIDQNKEQNVIREKNEVVDFTHPVDVLSDVEEKEFKKDNKDKKTPKKKKKRQLKLVKKFKEWWQGLSKIKKTITILATILVLLLIIIGILFLTKKDNNKDKSNTPDVIVKSDYYRYENGTLVFLGAEDKELCKYKCKNKDEKKCYIAFQSNEDEFSGDIYLDDKGNKIDIRAKIINDNYVFIVDNKKGSNDDIILYSIKSKSNIDEYTLVKETGVNKSYVVLKDKDDKYGVLDLTESTPKVLINFVYDYAGMINNEMSNKYLVLKKNSKYYVADYTEKLLSGGFSDKIVDYNDDFIVTKNQENKYKVYDYEDNDLQSKSYLFVKLINSYYAVLQDNGLLVFDKEGNRYNETPIALTSTNYNRTYVLDVNGQVISNEVAFEIETNDDYITITRGKAIDTLSIKEAMTNKEHPYLNYYNGILYFYADEAKNTLIGKYTCKNRNNAGSLDQCNIASSSSISNNDLTNNVPSGKISIINGRYVFVKDSLSTGNIYLYDLKTNKKLGPYNDVEAYDLISEKESVKNVNGAYVIAKNKNNMYGLLRINNQSVDVVLNFEYSEMEKEGEYFLVKKSNGYALINQSGNQLTKEIPLKIVSYSENYCLASSSSGYLIYNYNGEKIDNTTYSYIKLASNYYIGILTNNLGIYKYNNPGINVLQSEVKIKYPESWRNSNYFKVTASTLGYIIQITDGENNKEYTFDDAGNLKI